VGKSFPCVPTEEETFPFLLFLRKEENCSAGTLGGMRAEGKEGEDGKGGLLPARVKLFFREKGRHLTYSLLQTTHRGERREKEGGRDGFPQGEKIHLANCLEGEDCGIA